MLNLLDFSVSEIVEKIEWFNLGFENDLNNWSDKIGISHNLHGIDCPQRESKMLI